MLFLLLLLWSVRGQTCDEKKTVLLMHSNDKYLSMTENMITQFKEFPFERRLVAFDNTTFEYCQQKFLNTECILDSDTGFMPGVARSARRFIHPYSLLSILKAGKSVLTSDTDVVWFRNPLPFFEKHPEIEFFYSSDSLAEGPFENSFSNLNCGVMYLRPTPWVISIVEEWVQRIIDTPELWDQRLLREVMRDHHQDKNRTLGLPIKLFPNGHFYFVQQRHDKSPIMVHNTFVYVGIPGKIWRFMDYGLWKIPYPYDNRTNLKYLTYTPTYLNMTPPGPIPHFRNPNASMWVRDTHGIYIEHQLRELEAVWNIARKEGRILILPQIKCIYDRAWWNTDGYWPGSIPLKVPFDCPSDYIFRLDGLYFPRKYVRPRGFKSPPQSTRMVQPSELVIEPSNEFRRNFTLPWCCLNNNVLYHFNVIENYTDYIKS